MAELTGKNVQFFPVQSKAAQIEAMRKGCEEYSTAEADARDRIAALA